MIKMVPKATGVVTIEKFRQGRTRSYVFQHKMVPEDGEMGKEKVIGCHHPLRFTRSKGAWFLEDGREMIGSTRDDVLSILGKTGAKILEGLLDKVEGIEYFSLVPEVEPSHAALVVRKKAWRIWGRKISSQIREVLTAAGFTVEEGKKK